MTNEERPTPHPGRNRDPDGLTDAEFLDEAADATLGDDRPIEVSAVRTVLRIRPFRVIWLSTLGSQVGGWMQNMILAAFVWEVTSDPVLTSLVAFCNLVPQLLFPTIGGMLADMIDRKRLLFWLTVEQLVVSLVLAWVARTDDFSRPALFACIFLVGVGAALEAPLMLAVAPALVPRDALAGAISLASVSLNVSRVVGPAIGAVLFVFVGPSWVFVLNASTYGFVLYGLTRVTFPRVEPSPVRGLRAGLLDGFRFIRRDPVAWKAFITVALFAALCGTYVPLLPAVADADWGVSSKSVLYGVLYATFGVGAIVGSLAVGTWFNRFHMHQVARCGLVAFGVTLAVYLSLDTAWPAFPVGFLMGVAHFTVITSVTTVFQGRIDHSVRGRVSGAWLMGLIGPLPVASIVIGWLIEHSTVNTVLYVNCAAALAIAWFADLRAGEP